LADIDTVIACIPFFGEHPFMSRLTILSLLAGFSLVSASKVLWLPVAQAQNAAPATTSAIATTPAAALFSPDEKARVVAYWSQPERYVVGVRTVEKEGPIVVRLMPEASVWLRAYNNAPRVGQKVSTQKRATPLTDTEQGKRWENWVVAKLSYDRWLSQKAADVANAQLGIAAAAVTMPAPTFPGVIPTDLLAAVGNPPAFYHAVLPRTYTIAFDDGQTLKYTDNIAASTSRNPSYRFAQGVQSFGLRLRDWPQQELSDVFAQVGLTPFEQHVVKAVSVLEGGFDSINTYDTGFVSVGFIQFATLGEGAGSLGAVLRREKQNSPTDFEKDFRRFGVDVDEQGVLVVLDPQTGAEVRG